MLNTLDRYLLREVLLTLAATVLVLLLMVLSHRLASYLGKAAAGGLAQGSIIQLLGLHALRYLVDVIPAALLLATMLALGRLYRDNEMVALSACGLGPLAVYRPLLLLALPLAAVLAVLALVLVPTAARLQYEVRDRAQQDAELWLVQPGTFREVDDGRHVVYVGALSDDARELRDIMIFSHPENLAAGPDGPDDGAPDQPREPSGPSEPSDYRHNAGAPAITSAYRGRQQIDANGARYLVLEQGQRYQGLPGRADYQVARFEQLRLRIATPEPGERRQRRRALPTRDLWRQDEPRLRAELQSRLGTPLSIIVLVLVAPLLARASPRQGRYGRMVAAILFYAIYANLLSVAEAWMERGITPAALGLWWVHGLMLIAIAGLYLHQYGLPRGGQALPA